MASTISRRGWLGIGAGVMLGMGGVLAIGQATQEANAQSAQGSQVRLSAEQLRINQRISQAAVRRSNESLQLLDPIRALPNQPQKVLGWRTGDLRDGAVTAPKIGAAAVTTDKLAPAAVGGEQIGDRAITPAKLSDDLREGQPRWAVVQAGSAQLVRNSGATAAAKLPEDGRYTVTFDRDITSCALQATLAPTDTAPLLTPGFITAWPVAGEPTRVAVQTAGADGTPVDSLPFHVTVLC